MINNTVPDFEVISPQSRKVDALLVDSLRLVRQELLFGIGVLCDTEAQDFIVSSGQRGSASLLVNVCL